jgi:putative transposase
MLVSAGGLSESEARWIAKLGINLVGLMKLWRHGLITYLRCALNAGILKSDLKDWQLKRLFSKKYETDWHVYLEKDVSKQVADRIGVQHS